MLDMYQSTWDSVDLAPVLLDTEINWDIQNVTVFFAAASRQVYLSIFDPNDRSYSILRPNLVAQNLDTLSIYYIGTCNL